MRPSSRSMALMAITTVLTGVFSMTLLTFGVTNSGAMSFTSFRMIVTWVDWLIHYSRFIGSFVKMAKWNCLVVEGYLDSGGEAFFGSFGLIGCHDNQIVQRLGLSIQRFGCEYGTVLRDLELLVLVTSADAVHQSSIISWKCTK